MRQFLRLGCVKCPWPWLQRAPDNTDVQQDSGDNCSRWGAQGVSTVSARVIHPNDEQTAISNCFKVQFPHLYTQGLIQPVLTSPLTLLPWLLQYPDAFSSLFVISNTQPLLFKRNTEKASLHGGRRKHTCIPAASVRYRILMLCQWSFFSGKCKQVNKRGKGRQQVAVVALKLLKK